MVNRLCSSGYIAVLLLAGIGAYRSSDRDWNWDLLAYTACALSWSEPDPVRIHALAYADAEAEVPVPSYKFLTEGTSYRADLARNPLHFVEQIPFYDAKVLYIGLIAGLHRLGATYISAMKLISTAGFLAIGAAFFVWARGYLNSLPSALLSGMFVLTQPILNLGKIFSADALSVAMIVWALYLLFEKGHVRPATSIGMVLLCCAILVRNDTLVLAVLTIGYLTIASGSPIKVRPVYGAMLIALICGTVFAVTHFGGGYGWRMSFYHGLVQRVPAPGESGAPNISFSDYLRPAAHSLREGLNRSSLPLFAFLAGACILLMKPKSRLYHLLLLNLAFSLIRILAYPGFEERYYVSTYVIVGAAFISVCATYPQGTKGSMPP